jgi:hypothetical protein
MPPFVQESLRLLRDPTQFTWTAIPLLVIVFYVYAVEIEKRNWSTVLAGLAFWSADWINEVVNALVLHFTGYAPIWTTTGKTNYQILCGCNYEIAVMFAISGIIFTKQLPKDRKAKIFGINSRIVLGGFYSIFSVIVEEVLYRTGSFHWAYGWWDAGHPYLIVIFGYATFYAAAAWVHDMEDHRSKLKAVGLLGGTAIAGLVIFGALGWI